MHHYFLLFCLVFLSACFNDSADGSRLIPLSDVVSSPAPDPYQPLDKIIRRGDFVKEKSGLSEAYLDEVLHNRIRRPAANLVLNGDSLQVCISSVGAPGEEWAASHDLIYLNAWGDTLSPLAMSLGPDHLGMVSPQTILKINRRTYLLNMLDESRSHIGISELEDARDLPVAASLTTRYKKLSVLDTNDEPTRISRMPDKELFVLFMNFPEGAEEILTAYRKFTELPIRKQEKTQVAVVNRYTRAPAEIKAFFLDNEIGFPLYFEGPVTCANLPCHERFPYFLKVNTAGRITDYYGWMEELGW
ncbi:hypothetical protein FUA23_09965 [Neolewinella aurantiaca]|uniref:Uncharacterized protein n=1 Tax=Neolewinella aurantiaca TaxID=2602767 RepID=A0A5C7FIB9_9BACT|nr:hypothetical protein [Neolewinella aurantiaca]TXF89521.1 hypothetical protein FUA23_09965 [Neolewinella aurantiaca]